MEGLVNVYEASLKGVRVSGASQQSTRSNMFAPYYISKMKNAVKE